VDAAVHLILRAENVLGEGPAWDPNRRKLYWCDIRAHRVHWLSPDSGGHGCFELTVRPSAVAIHADGRLLLATDAGLMDLHPATGALALRWPLTAASGFRSNEGKIDVAGRFWWSSMDDDEGARPGQVFVYHPNGRCEVAIDGVWIANTLACSPDGRTFYLSDSKLGVTDAFDLDPGSGRLSGRRRFARPDNAASPDGGAVDAEGYLWNAHWGGWRIVRYAPDGRIDRVVPMPVEQPTSCAFGGADLTTLFITSARDGLSGSALAAQPLAGGLFAITTEVPGLALPLFEALEPSGGEAS
jgi:sugar lactone lactonase YvrE